MWRPRRRFHNRHSAHHRRPPLPKRHAVLGKPVRKRRAPALRHVLGKSRLQVEEQHLAGLHRRIHQRIGRRLIATPAQATGHTPVTPHPINGIQKHHNSSLQPFTHVNSSRLSSSPSYNAVHPASSLNPQPPVLTQLCKLRPVKTFKPAQSCRLLYLGDALPRSAVGHGCAVYQIGLSPRRTATVFGVLPHPDGLLDTRLFPGGRKKWEHCWNPFTRPPT